MNKIKWRVGGIFNANAEKVYQELRDCGETYTPREVVEKAKDEQSELHKCFEWDDTIAAEKYRLHQARMLIANIVVEVEQAEGQTTELRLYQSNGRNNGYSESVLIARDVDRYAELLERAKSELDSFRKRYESIAELEEVITAIEEVCK